LDTQPTYVKAIKLKSRMDIRDIENEIRAGNILILKITPLVTEGTDQIREVIKELEEIIEKTGGDIARLGEERIVLTPKGVRIWRGHDREP
jgi:hypothetical protein